MSQSKYGEGDLVEFAGNRAIVTKVHEDHYFYGGDQPYYTYDLEYTNDGAIQKGVVEPALSLIRASERPVKPEKRMCECGAWATGSNSNEHSWWCPEKPFTPYKVKR
jgi:hypothetical protein